MPIGSGRFRLSRLLRGRRGTEWASGMHSVGERFALIEQAAMRSVPLPDWAVGSEVAAKVSGNPATAAAIVTGQSLRPPAPAHIAAMFEGSGDLALSWVRRSRRGWAWIDGVDAPLAEGREEYRVTLISSPGAFEWAAVVPQLTIPAADVALAGSGTAVVEIRQIGDWGASHAARIDIIIPQETT